MVIRVNGQEETLMEPFTLLEYLQHKGVNPATVVIERNGEIPVRENWGKIALVDGDALELVKFVGGG